MKNNTLKTNGFKVRTAIKAGTVRATIHPPPVVCPAPTPLPTA